MVRNPPFIPDPFDPGSWLPRQPDWPHFATILVKAAIRLLSAVRGEFGVMESAGYDKATGWVSDVDQEIILVQNTSSLLFRPPCGEGDEFRRALTASIEGRDRSRSRAIKLLHVSNAVPSALEIWKNPDCYQENNALFELPQVTFASAFEDHPPIPRILIVDRKKCMVVSNVGNLAYYIAVNSKSSSGQVDGIATLIENSVRGMKCNYSKYDAYMLEIQRLRRSIKGGDPAAFLSKVKEWLIRKGAPTPTLDHPILVEPRDQTIVASLAWPEHKRAVFIGLERSQDPAWAEVGNLAAIDGWCCAVLPLTSFIMHWADTTNYLLRFAGGRSSRGCSTPAGSDHRMKRSHSSELEP